MIQVLLLLISFIGTCFCLYEQSNAEIFEKRFEGWKHKHLDLISFFLPRHPVILHAGRHDHHEFIALDNHWPASTLINECDLHEEGIPPVDFLYLNLEETTLQFLKGLEHFLNGVTCIYIKTNFVRPFTGIFQYQEVRDFLKLSGFRLVAHWLKNGLQGNAIFVRGDFYDDYENCEEIEKAWSDVEKNYEKCSIDRDISLYIDAIPDSIKSCLKKESTWEGNIGLIIEGLSREGSVVIDIGAHIGVHTITMSRKVGSRGAVIAFEPQRKIYLEQLQNLKLNHCTNVISISKALGEKTGIVQLTKTDPTNEGGTTIGEGGESIQMISLDSLNLTNVSLIKIDVENYEFFTLQGAQYTILNNLPVIIFEVNGSNIEPIDLAKEKENFDRVMTLIRSWGYQVCLIYGKDYIAFPSGTKEKYLKLVYNRLNNELVLSDVD